MPGKRVIGDGDRNVYHVVSRVVDRQFLFGSREKRFFRQTLRRLLRFSGLRCVTYCLMDNHFHLVLEVPSGEGRRFATSARANEVFERLSHLYRIEELEEIRERYRREIRVGGMVRGQAFLQQFVRRMYDLSVFMKELKWRFSRWYNAAKERTGTLWEARFKSILLEGRGLSLRAVAAYVDLNPVRAGLVQDPKDYPWSGYGEAVAGGILAQEGIAMALDPEGGCPPPQRRWQETQATYRVLLMVGEGAPAGQSGRSKLDPVVVAETIRSGGKLRLWELLRCRIRYFTDGLVVGSEEFVEDFFQRERGRFGESRASGARRLRYGEWGGICTLRDLQRDPVEPPTY